MSTLPHTVENNLEEDWEVESLLRAVTDLQWSKLWVIAAAISELSTPGKWESGNVIDRTDDGHNVYVMPFIIYAEPVTRYEQLFYEMNLVVPYQMVLDRGRTIHQLEWIETATTVEVVQFNSSILRGDRFSEGYIAAAINSGAIAAIVRNLKIWHKNRFDAE